MKCGARPALSKRRRKANSQMDTYVIVGNTGQRDDDTKSELPRLPYSIVNSVLGEMDHRFSERNSQLAVALSALNLESTAFLVFSAVKHIMDLSQADVIETDFKVAKQFFSSQKQSEPMGVDWTVQYINSSDGDAKCADCV